MANSNIAQYLTTLIEEKGKSLDDVIGIDGHYGLTYEILIEFIAQPSMEIHVTGIKTMLVKIDFANGDWPWPQKVAE